MQQPARKEGREGGKGRRKSQKKVKKRKRKRKRKSKEKKKPPIAKESHLCDVVNIELEMYLFRSLYKEN